MYILNLILLLLLILIFYLVIINVINYENFKILKYIIFLQRDDNEKCNIKDNLNFKCGWKVIDIYPKKNRAKFTKNNVNIVIVNKGLKGEKGENGENGKNNNKINKKAIIEKINKNKVNNLEIKNQNMNIKSDKILLNNNTKICFDKNCLEIDELNKFYKNIL